jgi:hypothetical protein
MSRALLVLNTHELRMKAARWIASVPPGTRVEFKAPKRSLPQNDKMWAMLTEVAEQATWAGKKRTPDDWKDLFTTAVKMATNQSLEAVPGLEGGLMILGLRTSDMTVAEMADLITYMESKAADLGVTFSDVARDGAGDNPASVAA